jgi:hypothetical protein
MRLVPSISTDAIFAGCQRNFMLKTCRSNQKINATAQAALKDTLPLECCYHVMMIIFEAIP